MKTPVSGSGFASTAADHNQYTHRGYVFQANSRSGLRILDLERGQQQHLGDDDAAVAGRSRCAADPHRGR